jgi:hypothetical protein
MPSPAVQRFLCRLRPEVAGSFTTEQLAAIELYFGMRHFRQHGIDWRGRLKLPFMKLYFVFLAGQDLNGA